MVCKFCGTNLAEGTKFCMGCGAKLDEPIVTPPPMDTGVNASHGMNFDFDTNNAAPVGNTKRYEYKVLSQKDKWFSGKFDPMLLEQAINAYAQQGWRVIGCATADVPGFTASRQEFVTLLEREI